MNKNKALITTYRIIEWREANPVLRACLLAEAWRQALIEDDERWQLKVEQDFGNEDFDIRR